MPVIIKKATAQGEVIAADKILGQGRMPWVIKNQYVIATEKPYLQTTN